MDNFLEQLLTISQARVNINTFSLTYFLRNTVEQH